MSTSVVIRTWFSGRTKADLIHCVPDYLSHAGFRLEDTPENVISAALIFYVLTVVGVFRLRFKRPNAPRPYRTLGYPFVPGFYIFAATVILVVLFVYRPSTTWPGLLMVVLGIPVYLVIRGAARTRTGQAYSPQTPDAESMKMERNLEDSDG